MNAAETGQSGILPISQTTENLMGKANTLLILSAAQGLKQDIERTANFRRGPMHTNYKGVTQ